MWVESLRVSTDTIRIGRYGAHVLNRGVGRQNLFDKDGDFPAFERVLQETLRIPARNSLGLALAAPNELDRIGIGKRTANGTRRRGTSTMRQPRRAFR